MNNLFNLLNKEVFYYEEKIKTYRNIKSSICLLASYNKDNSTPVDETVNITFNANGGKIDVTEDTA